MVEVGSANKKLKVGDHVVVPFTTICGACDQCRRGNFSVCERTNRNEKIGDTAFGHATAGPFGCTHLTGWLPRQPGPVRARALCRRRPRQGPRRPAA